MKARMLDNMESRAINGHLLEDSSADMWEEGAERPRKRGVQRQAFEIGPGEGNFRIDSCLQNASDRRRSETDSSHGSAAPEDRLPASPTT